MSCTFPVSPCAGAHTPTLNSQYTSCCFKIVVESMAAVPAWPPTWAEKSTWTRCRRPRDRTLDGAVWFDFQPSSCRSASDLLSLHLLENSSEHFQLLMIYTFISTVTRGGGGRGGQAGKQHKEQNIHLSSVYVNEDKLMLITR